MISVMEKVVEVAEKDSDAGMMMIIAMREVLDDVDGYLEEVERIDQEIFRLLVDIKAYHRNANFVQRQLASLP